MRTTGNTTVTLDEVLTAVGKAYGDHGHIVECDVALSDMWSALLLNIHDRDATLEELDSDLATELTSRIRKVTPS